jgi:hypothetical protein
MPNYSVQAIWNAKAQIWVAGSNDMPSLARESVVRNTRGQTMTDYALILAAIAVVVFGIYRALGDL